MRLFGFGRREPTVDDGAVAASRAADRAEAAFRSAYGTAPTGVWWAPATLALCGDHFGGGDTRVLSVALPWGAGVALAPADDTAVEVRSTRSPSRPVRLPGRHPRRVPGWAAAVLAALAVSGGAVPGLRVMVDLGPFDAAPHATVACAVLLAATEIHRGADAAADRAVLARTARKVLADHIASDTADAVPETALRATADHAFLLDRRTGRGRPLPLPLGEAGLRLLVVDAGTAVPGRLAAERRAECARAAAALGVSALRDVADLAGALAALDDATLRLRVRHAVAETHRVNAVAGLLHSGAAEEIGPALSASHLSLRDAFATVCPRLDTAADTAVRRGARGARMTGSGRRAVALVPDGRVAAVRAGIDAAFAARRWPAPRSGAAAPAGGARRLR
ncbi:galactokinase family protein [Thermobifida halotolerans]|uniref:galactokinase family protein n=1 Tax=Thermobifida halotolerans TaxID=483545 RepID=UPI000A01F926|nr:galactokinase family protein [Thermobifida halotolerans]